MTVEEKAFEAFPVDKVWYGMDDSPAGDNDWYDRNEPARLGYIYGYKDGMNRAVDLCEEAFMK